MEIHDLFYKWVPAPVKLLLLLVLLFALLVSNGVYLGNITDMYSSLGVYAEPYTMASNALYIGMGIGLIAGLRLKLRFSSRTLVIYGLVNLVLMNLVCAVTSNPAVVVLASFWLGLSKMTALIEIFIIWMLIWARKPDTTKVYPFIYSMALGGIYFTTWVTSRVSYFYNWRYPYLFIILLLIFCLIISFLLMEDHPLKRILPLYQMDWSGLLLFALSLMLVNYIFVYGKVEDWLNSVSIRTAFILLIFSAGLFVIRERSVKRPMVNLNLFRSAHLRTGLFLFLLMGVFAPATFQSVFASAILKYEGHRVSELNLYMLPGVLAGAAICFYWYQQQFSRHLLIMIGFFFFTLYHLMMYRSFGTDFSMADFIWPSVCKGFAMVVIYISVGLYATTGMSVTQAISGAGLVIIVRSFLGTAICSGIYNYYLYAQRIRHFDRLSSWTDASDQVRLSDGGSALYLRLQHQATLAAVKELTGYILIAGVFILLGLAALLVVKGLAFSRRSFGGPVNS